MSSDEMYNSLVGHPKVYTTSLLEYTYNYSIIMDHIIYIGHGGDNVSGNKTPSLWSPPGL